MGQKLNCSSTTAKPTRCSLLLWGQQVVKDHSDFLMGRQAAKHAVGGSSRMWPPFLQLTDESLASAQCCVLQGWQYLGEWTSGLWILPSSQTFGYVRTLGNEVDASLRKLRCVTRRQRDTRALRACVLRGGRYMNTALSRAPNHIFLLVASALGVEA